MRNLCFISPVLLTLQRNGALRAVGPRTHRAESGNGTTVAARTAGTGTRRATCGRFAAILFLCLYSSTADAAAPVTPTVPMPAKAPAPAATPTVSVTPTALHRHPCRDTDRVSYADRAHARQGAGRRGR